MPKQDDVKKKANEPSRREEFRARRKREQLRNRLIPIILIGVAAIAVVIILIVTSQQNAVVSRPQADGLAMGNKDALVKVEEFADFQCPACGVFSSEVEPKIVKDFIDPGKIYFKYSPFSFLGPESNSAAEAAYCASDQNKFWEYHDTLFNNQRGENQGWFSASRLTTFANDLKLNVDEFKTCLDNGKYKQQVLDDVEYGKKNNIDRTPSFLVNGRLVYADTVYTVIESELKAKGVK
jgi:protein-disulfide isomerase